MDQTGIEDYLQWRWHLMEDDLKILKVQNLSNQLFDHHNLLNFSLGDHDLQLLLKKTTSKYQKWNISNLMLKTIFNWRRNISVNTDLIGSYTNFDIIFQVFIKPGLIFHRGFSYEIQELISSVALINAAQPGLLKYKMQILTCERTGAS